MSVRQVRRQVAAMKLELTNDLVQKISLLKVPQAAVEYAKWKPTDKPNYLVYDSSRKAPPGFAVRVGARASVYLVEKTVRGKKLKIDVGLARGKRGAEKEMSIEKARDTARDKIADAVKHGTNPNRIADAIEAAELTFGMVWDRYIADLLGRARPIKKNSPDSINKARDKFEDWEDRKVRLITGQEVLDRFDLHAVKNGHKTAAEAKMPGSRKGLIYVKNGKEVDHKAEENAGGEWVLPSGIPCEVGHYGDLTVAMGTVRERAGIKAVRGHDLRRTFGAASEKLELADRRVKRMLGHAVGGGETLGRYAEPEWKDHVERMAKIEHLILKSAPAVYNALRPAKEAALPEKGDVVIKLGPIRKSQPTFRSARKCRTRVRRTTGSAAMRCFVQ